MADISLHTTYFGPIQWYQLLYRSENVIINGYERWQKQTIRNRCLIATANGVQTLSVPIVHSHRRPEQTRDICISNHGKWRREHWNALQSAYGESPFFDYYVDDLRPFFENQWESLFDFNLAIIYKVCELLDIHPNIQVADSNTQDALNHPVFSNSHPTDNNFLKEVQEQTPYYQVYQQKFGFLPNLSILDLLFNMGNEAIFYL